MFKMKIRYRLVYNRKHKLNKNGVCTSILGEQQKALSSTADLNTIVDIGSYRSYSFANMTHTPANMTNDSGILAVEAGVDSGWRIQTLYLNNGETWKRSLNVSNPLQTWWRDDNYKTTSLAGLASTLGGTYVRQLTAEDDLDNIKSSGVYICNASVVGAQIANNPCGGAFRLEVLPCAGPSFPIQRLWYANRVNPKLFVRYYESTWGDWRVIEGTVVS